MMEEIEKLSQGSFSQETSKSNARTPKTSKLDKFYEEDKPNWSEEPEKKGELVENFWTVIKKIQLPYFDREDLANWVMKVETFFQIQEIHMNTKLKLAKVSIEGVVVHQYNLWSKSEINLMLQKFKQALLLQFGGFNMENAFENLTEIQQTKFVDEYIEQLEFKATQVLILLKNN